MKNSFLTRFTCATLLASLASVLIATSSQAESRFGLVLGTPLEGRCLSDNETDRGICIGYIEAMLDMSSHRLSNSDVQCFSSDLLALRNAALHGWQEIQDLLEWADERLSAGDIPTEIEQFAIDQSKKLATDVQDRIKLLTDVRRGSPPAMYRPCILENADEWCKERIEP
jgi:hypothetical protein